MADVVQYRFVVKRDTAANFAAANTMLFSGEFGLETDTRRIKLGDGTTAWNSLKYVEQGLQLALLADVDNSAKADGFSLVWDATAGKHLYKRAGADYQAGLNIGIDKSNPALPVISSTVGAINLKGTVTSYAGLPSSGNTNGDAYYNYDDGLFYVYSSGAWPASGAGINTTAFSSLTNQFTGALQVPRYFKDTSGKILSLLANDTISMTGSAFWNPSLLGTNVLLDASQRTAYQTSGGSSSGGLALSNNHYTSSLRYAEIICTLDTASSAGCGILIGTTGLNNFIGSTSNGFGTWAESAGANRDVYTNNTSKLTVTAASLGIKNAIVGQRVRIAANATTGRIWFSYIGAGAWVGGGDPAAGTSPTYTFTAGGDMYLAANPRNPGTNFTIVDPSDYWYTMPAGASAW